MNYPNNNSAFLKCYNDYICNRKIAKKGINQKEHCGARETAHSVVKAFATSLAM